MKLTALLTRYLVSASLSAVVQVGLILGGLYLTFQLVRELGDLEGGYGVVQMLAYLLRTFPTGLYDMFPFIVLIGCMIAAGRLASSHELVAMRASGFDRRHIASRIMLVVLGLSLFMMAMAEWWMPALEMNARADREQARSGQLSASQGREIWIRDANRMIQAELLVNDPALGVRFANLQFYELNDRYRPVQLVHARFAVHQDRQWRLQEVQRMSMAATRAANQVRLAKQESLVLESSINPDVFLALSTRPRLMSMRDIRRISGYLDQNELDTSRYQEAFWRRLFYPLNILAMVLAGLPLLFRADRQLAPATSVFAGIAVGIAFFIVWRTVTGLSGLLPLPLWQFHLVPAVLFIGFGLWRLQKG